MESYKLDPTQTGWIAIKGNVETIVAYFNDGHKETMPLLKFIAMNSRKRRKVIQIDCYTKGEKIG